MNLLHRDAKAARLREVEFFADADKSAINHLAMAADEVTIPAGQTLMSEGHRHNEGYVILDGHLAVIVGGTKVAEIDPGQVIGDLALFTKSVVASATVRAETDVEALVIPYSRFDQILDENPAFTKAIAVQLAFRLQAMDALYSEG